MLKLNTKKLGKQRPVVGRSNKGQSFKKNKIVIQQKKAFLKPSKVINQPFTRVIPRRRN